MGVRDIFVYVTDSLLLTLEIFEKYLLECRICKILFASYWY